MNLFTWSFLLSKDGFWEDITALGVIKLVFWQRWMLLLIGLFIGWWRGGITSTFIAWLGSWLRDRERSVEVIFDAYSFFVRHRYLRFENLNLSYTSKTLESLRKLKKKKCVIQKDIENPHNLGIKMFNEAMKVMNKKLTKLNYPVYIFSLLTRISPQLYLLSSSRLFLSVKRGFKFICNGWSQFSKHTWTFLIFKKRNFGILIATEWICVLNKLSFGAAAYRKKAPPAKVLPAP